MELDRREEIGLSLDLKIIKDLGKMFSKNLETYILRLYNRFVILK